MKIQNKDNCEVFFCFSPVIGFIVNFEKMLMRIRCRLNRGDLHEITGVNCTCSAILIRFKKWYRLSLLIRISFCLIVWDIRFFFQASSRFDSFRQHLHMNVSYEFTICLYAIANLNVWLFYSYSLCSRIHLSQGDEKKIQGDIGCFRLHSI